MMATFNEEVKTALMSGAKSSSIAAWLRNHDYCVYTYGWDMIDDGHYFVYDDSTKDWHLDDTKMKVEKSYDKTREFYYRCAIDAAMVSTIKSMLV